MKRTLIVALGLIAMLVPAALAARVQDEGLANAILATRKKNAALLRDYNWNCRTEILENDKMLDLRIDLVSVGAAGQLSRSLLNDQPGKVPHGFLRRAIAQGQQKQAEQMVEGLSKLVDQYTLPSAGKIIAYIVQANVQPVTSADGQSLLQVTGSSVVVPGDRFTMVYSAKGLHPVNVQVSTSFNGDAVTVNGSFHTGRSGLSSLQYATAVVPSKKIKVMIHNYDFEPIN